MHLLCNMLLGSGSGPQPGLTGGWQGLCLCSNASVTLCSFRDLLGTLGAAPDTTGIVLTGSRAAHAAPTEDIHTCCVACVPAAAAASVCLRPGKRFSVGMCSLEGHQLAGEERFAVDMLPDGSVWWVGAGWGVLALVQQAGVLYSTVCTPLRLTACSCWLGLRSAVCMSSRSCLDLEGRRLLFPDHRDVISPLCGCCVADTFQRYDVFLFSKPDTLLALVSLPVVKLMQLRYVNDSAAAVAKAVQ